MPFSRFYHIFKNPFLQVRQHPVIILGNQKSGTSVIAHLLAAAGGLSKTIDIPPLWASGGFDIIQGKVTFKEIVRKNRRFFTTAIIKEPMMTFFTDQVLALFPEAKYVFIIRDPRDNIRSLLDRRNLPGHLEKLSGDDMANLNPIQRATIDSRIWGGADENYIGVLAHRWNKAAGQYHLNRDCMIPVKYEDFMKDKQNFILKLAQSLGIPVKNDISESLDIQYQPRGNRDISWIDFFGGKNLQRIQQICEKKMECFGYQPIGVARRP